jgi:hypothetical protein
MSEDMKIVVACFIPNKGADFCGIFSNWEDAEKVAFDNTDRGDVICVKFEQTINNEISAERGVYTHNAEMKIFEYEEQKRYLS